MNEMFGRLISEAKHCCMSDEEAEAWGREWLKDLAQNIRDEFPDTNPLASSLFDYVGYEIADYIESLGR